MSRLQRRMRALQSLRTPILTFVMILICLLTIERTISRTDSRRLIPLNKLAKDSLRRKYYENWQHLKDNRVNLKETIKQRSDKSNADSPIVAVVVKPLVEPEREAIHTERSQVGKLPAIKGSNDKDNAFGKVSKTGDGILEQINTNIEDPGSVMKQLHVDVFDSSRHRCFRLTWNNANLARLMTANRTCRIVTLPNDAEFGRVGNNLFRLAALIGIAERLDFIPIVSPLNPLTEYFDLPNLYTVDMTNFSAFQAPHCCRYYSGIENLDPNKDWVIYGYMQSWRYFQNARQVLKQTLRIKEIHTKAVDQFLEGGTRTEGLRNVCIHVRRGDMDHILSEIQGYSVAGVEFIEHAVEYFERKLHSAKYMVVSDDMQWCRNNLEGKRFILSPFIDPGSDIALLMRCDHVIVTSGSFGWWGAWLGGRESVYFKGFPIRFSKVGRQTNFTDYYPSNWIGMS